MASSATILIAIVFASLVADSYQLKCYECSEGASRKLKLKSLSEKSLDSACGSFADDLLVQCPTQSEVCTKLEGEAGGVSASVHGCGTTKAACDAADGNSVGGVSMSCYSCDTDGCNSASGIAATAGLLVLAAIAARFY